ncbi:MAG: hypothetical protein H0X65_12180 [Gemmatimonadetes bacterium]|nr:hypothetical protein [Gemmatimonadota bacterium]
MLKTLLLGSAAVFLLLTATWQQVGRSAAGRVAAEIEDDVMPLLPDQRFGAELLSWPGRTPWQPAESCWAAFVCEPRCPWCQELAGRIAPLEGDATPVPYWILAGRDAEIDEFVRRHRLSPDRVLRIRQASDEERDVLRNLGIFATPTRLLLDEHAVVRDTRLLPEVPTHEELRHLCAGGFPGQPALR